MSFVKLSIFGTSFEVTPRYVDLQPVGMGAFGLVCSAKDQLTGASVAIKKIMKPFSTPVLAKRTYRELKLLIHIQHENACIISLSDVFISPLEDMYFVTELLGTDLHRLLTSRPLEKQFIQYFLYQILVCQLHSTRYYRAPEIMLTWQKYDVAVDIWSTGCIFAEMLEGKPLFPGKDRTSLSSFEPKPYPALSALPTSFAHDAHQLIFVLADVNQFSIITELLGTPPDDVIETICSENVRVVLGCLILKLSGDFVTDPQVRSKPSQAGTRAF
ncbi:MAPK protein hog1 [Termitomyces sp. T32_za158]|nr:MAPK protein hog1 [Termitomyces sp. T32_za158]